MQGLQNNPHWRRLITELNWIEEHACSVKHHLESGNEKRSKQELRNLIEAITSAQQLMLRIEAESEQSNSNET